eukprot:Colp12_sorted_trinity150504_noHs@21125
MGNSQAPAAKEVPRFEAHSPTSPITTPAITSTAAQPVPISSPVRVEARPPIASSPPDFGSPLNSPIVASQFDFPSQSRRKPTIQSPLQSVQPKEAPQVIPTVFRWKHGGKQVFITGTFNDWKGRIPLNRSHDEFTTILDLPVGTHQYKFIVDDEFKWDNAFPTMPDQSGAMNNYLEIFPQEPEDGTCELTRPPTAPGSPPGSYGQTLPTFNDSSRTPPILPPHLLQVLLNAEPVSEEDPTLLPVPNHVLLNHLYALSVKDGVMVLGVTHRYKKKYVTTVLYKPV